jgi:SHS2 domain-containing protein
MPERAATFDHTGDLGLEIEADGPERLHALAAEALCRQIALAAPGGDDVAVSLALDGDDPRDLFVHFLNTVLLEAEVRHAIWTHVTVSALTPTHLEARLAGQDLEGGAQVRMREIKAVSHHALELELAPGRSHARFVLDL